MVCASCGEPSLSTWCHWCLRRGFGPGPASAPPPRERRQAQAPQRTPAHGLAVRCTGEGCTAILTLPITAPVPLVSSVLARALREGLVEQGATAGPVNPVTGFAPLRCRACSSERVQVTPVAVVHP